MACFNYEPPLYSCLTRYSKDGAMRKDSYLFTQLYGVMGGLHPAGRAAQLRSATWEPMIDVYERANGIVIIAELPGVDKERINVAIEEGKLKISGFRPKQIPDAAQHVHQMEIPYGPFAREIPLPDWADVGCIQAGYEGGYLTVEVPRVGTP